MGHQPAPGTYEQGGVVAMCAGCDQRIARGSRGGDPVAWRTPSADDGDTECRSPEQVA